MGLGLRPGPLRGAGDLAETIVLERGLPDRLDGFLEPGDRAGLGLLGSSWGLAQDLLCQRDALEKLQGADLGSSDRATRVLLLLSRPSTAAACRLEMGHKFSSPRYWYARAAGFLHPHSAPSVNRFGFPFGCGLPWFRDKP